jgi:choline dehydrogenase-like flavoprotein
MDKRFDVIIIGSGAGGGTLARHGDRDRHDSR